MRRAIERDRRLQPLGGDQTLDDLPSPSAFDADAERSDRTERIERVRRAVLSLPTPYREVLVLCDLQQKSYALAAEQLDCPVGTIRSRLNRARALVMAKLSGTRRLARSRANELRPRAHRIPAATGGRVNMTCKEFQEIAHELLHSESAVVESVRLGLAHTFVCEECAAYLAAERTLDEQLAELAAVYSESQAPPRVEHALMAAFRARGGRATSRRAKFGLPQFPRAGPLPSPSRRRLLPSCSPDVFIGELPVPANAPIQRPRTWLRRRVRKSAPETAVLDASHSG